MSRGTTSWDRLTVFGEPRPCAPSDEVPSPIAELLTRWGPGLLCGHYAVAEPGEAWRALQERARELRLHGYFAGLPTVVFESLVVFAADADGHALAAARVGEVAFYLLTSGGCVVPLGTSVDELLDALPSRTSLLFPRLDQVWDASSGTYLPKFDWGIELSYVVPGFRGHERYLDALASGRDDDDLLPEAVAGFPTVVALHRLLSFLCGPRGDAIPEDVRADAVEPLVRKVRRRFDRLPGVVAELFEPSPWRSPIVRGWATSPTLLHMRPGPFGAEDHARAVALPIVEPLPDDARAPLSAPAMDPEALLDHWLIRWDALPGAAESASLRRVRALATGLPSSIRFAVTRRLAWDRWPAEASRYPLPESCRELVDRLGTRPIELDGPHVAEAWPLFLVYLVHATTLAREPSERAGNALFEVQAPELTKALVALTELGLEWPVATFPLRGTGLRVPRLLNGEKPDDEDLERLLPSLKKKGVGDELVELVMSRMDQPRVYELALRSLAKWPTIVAPLLVARPGPRTEAALRAALGAKRLMAREAVAKALADLGDAKAQVLYEETKRKIDESI